MSVDRAEDAAGSRFGYSLATLRASQRRFITACYAVMAVVGVALAVWLALVSTGDWWSEFALPFLIAIGAGLLAFILGMVLTQVLRQLVPQRWRLVTDTVALSVTTLFGLFAVSFFVDSWATLVSALLGVVVATAAPLSVATSPVTAILRDAPHADAVAEELRAMPSWSHLLEGRILGTVVGVAADLVYRCASLVLLWLGAWWLLPLLVLALVEGYLSALGVARGNRALWLAPGILSAVLTVTAALLLGLAS